MKGKRSSIDEDKCILHTAYAQHLIITFNILSVLFIDSIRQKIEQWPPHMDLGLARMRVY